MATRIPANPYLEREDLAGLTFPTAANVTGASVTTQYVRPPIVRKTSATLARFHAREFNALTEQRRLDVMQKMAAVPGLTRSLYFPHTGVGEKGVFSRSLADALGTYYAESTVNPTAAAEAAERTVAAAAAGTAPWNAPNVGATKSGAYGSNAFMIGLGAVIAIGLIGDLMSSGSRARAKKHRGVGEKGPYSRWQARMLGTYAPESRVDVLKAVNYGTRVLHGQKLIGKPTSARIKGAGGRVSRTTKSEALRRLTGRGSIRARETTRAERKAQSGLIRPTPSEVEKATQRIKKDTLSKTSRAKRRLSTGNTIASSQFIRRGTLSKRGFHGVLAQILKTAERPIKLTKERTANLLSSLETAGKREESLMLTGIVGRRERNLQRLYRRRIDRLHTGVGEKGPTSETLSRALGTYEVDSIADKIKVALHGLKETWAVRKPQLNPLRHTVQIHPLVADENARLPVRRRLFKQLATPTSADRGLELRRSGSRRPSTPLGTGIEPRRMRYSMPDKQRALTLDASLRQPEVLDVQDYLNIRHTGVGEKGPYSRWQADRLGTYEIDSVVDAIKAVTRTVIKQNAERAYRESIRVARTGWEILKDKMPGITKDRWIHASIGGSMQRRNLARALLKRGVIPREVELMAKAELRSGIIHRDLLPFMPKQSKLFYAVNSPVVRSTKTGEALATKHAYNIREFDKFKYPVGAVSSQYGGLPKALEKSGAVTVNAGEQIRLMSDSGIVKELEKIRIDKRSPLDLNIRVTMLDGPVDVKTIDKHLARMLE